MKVMYVVSTLKRAGPTAQLLNIISNLKPDIKPVLVTLSPEPAESRLADFQARGIEIVSLNLGRFAGAFKALTKLKELIRAHRPDLLHCQGIRADMLASKLNAELPAVCTVRNFPQLDYAMTYGTFLGKVMAIRHLSALKMVKQAVGVSDGVTDNLLKLKVSSAVTVRNGVDTKLYFPASASHRKALRAANNISDDAFVFIATGHLTARKNPLLLVSAFKAAFVADDNVRLLLVGDGDQYDLCKDAAVADPRIIFVGRVAAVNDYLAMADVYVSSSLAEGLPNAALEAMACELPVVLSDIAPHQELLELGGEVGYAFALQDSSQLSQRLKSIVEQDLTLFKDNLRKLISEQLSAAGMSSRYQALYRELVVK